MVIIVVKTVTTLADAKARFSELVASEATHKRTMITKNGRPAVVIISAEDLESLEETLAIMSDPELLSAVRDRAGEPAEPISKDDSSTVLSLRTRDESASPCGSRVETSTLVLGTQIPAGFDPFISFY